MQFVIVSDLKYALGVSLLTNEGCINAGEHLPGEYFKGQKARWLWFWQAHTIADEHRTPRLQQCARVYSRLANTRTGRIRGSWESLNCGDTTSIHALVKLSPLTVPQLANRNLVQAGDSLLG